MKLVRCLALAGVVAGVVLAAALILAFNSSFQTYLVRQAIGRRPDMRVTVASVSAGLRRVEVHDVSYERDGVVLKLPAVEADIPVFSAAIGEKLLVKRLVAKGWTVDLSKQGGPAAAAPQTPTAVQATAAAAGVFSGVFSQIRLPVDLALDNVQLEGDVILPESRGRVKVVIQGGGLEAGREGQFTLRADAALADPAVNRLRVDATIAATLDTPRTLARLVTKLDAEASGQQFPNGVKLAADLSAGRAALGESYRVAIVSQGRQLVLLSGEFPAHARRLDGTWKLDVHDTDIAPFALGKPLPLFVLAGEGTFDVDATLTGVHASGRINGNADRLTALRPELVGIGAVKLNADFDLAQKNGVVAVERLDASVAANQPIATIRSLQPFELNPATGALKAADPSSELLDVVLQGVPLSWAAPMLKDISVSGGDVRGEVVMTSRGGGMTLRAKTPVTIEKMGVTRAGQPLVAGADLSFNFTSDYTPQGWQTEISGLTAKSERGLLVGLDARIGKLAGRDQPFKATGTLTGNLPALLAQPGAKEALAVTAGDASIEFVAAVSAKTELQAKVRLRNLGAAGTPGAEKLPAISADLRADVNPNGQVALNVPIKLERDGRASDLTLAGTVTPAKEGQHIEMQAVSTQLYVDDAKILAATLPVKAKTEEQNETPAPRRGNAPVWAGYNGTVGLQFKKLIYGDMFEATNVAGTLRLDAGSLKVEQFQAGLGENGDARLNAAVTYNRAAKQPYGLEAALTVSDFDPGPLLRAMTPNQPATIEGRFNINSKLTGQAPTLAELLEGAIGDFQLSSRGGTFRGLPVSFATKLETTSSIAAGLAKLGNLANSIGGKSDKGLENIANRAQAVAEVTNYWRAIPYDQLSVTLSRDANLTTALKDFALISPELRLSGGGRAMHKLGTSVFDDALQMEYKLRARGHHAELLKYLGMLEESSDELGYQPAALPLAVGGTVGKPDTTELNDKLAAIALEKSGVSEKAVELFNRLRGATR